MRKISIDLVLAFFLVAMHCSVASGQDMLPTDTEAGTPSFSTAISLAPGISLDLPTGNVNVDIPVRAKTGKIPFSYDLITNSHVFWIPALGCGNPCYTYQWSSTIPLAGIQGASSIPVMLPYIVSSEACWNQWPYQIYQPGFTPCIPSPPMTAGYEYTWNNGAQPTTCTWYFADIRGTTHFFPTVPVILGPQGAAECPFVGVYPNGAVTTDGSGYQIVVLSDNPTCISGCGEIVLPNGSTATYTLTNYACGQDPPENGTYTFTDSDEVSITDTWNWQNGNYCDDGSAGMGQRVDTFTDTMTSPAVPLVTATIADLYDSPIISTQSTYTYTDGETPPQIQQFTVKYTPASVQTAFGCPDVQEVQSLYNNTYLPTEIDRPDGSQYKFAYEQTPGNPNPSVVTGRLASVTLPTGGSLQFTYVNTNGHYGIDCNSGVVPELKVKTNDGNGNVGTWIYYNTNTSSGATHFSAAIVDPNNNETLHYFSGTTNGVGSTSPPGGVFPTEVESYQGLQSGGTLLAANLVCYNNNFTNCQAPTTPVAYPIFQNDLYTFPVINGTIQTQNPSLVETKFDYTSSTGVTFGNVISVSKWDFGATLPPSNNTVSTTTIAYGTWDGSACVPTATNIVNTPCEIQVGNLVGGSLTNLTRHERSVYDSNGHRLETYDYTGSPIVPPGKAWQPNTYYSLDGVVIASSNEGGDLWQVTVPGTGGSNEPFSSGHSVGDTVSDNHVTWMMIQTAASLTWQPNTQYNPSQQVKGNTVGQYVVAAANGTNYLYKLQPTALPTIIEQSGSVPNMSSGDYVDLYFFDTSLNPNPGGWTYNGMAYTVQDSVDKLAGYATLHLNGANTNSILFNVPGDPDKQPIYYFQLDQAGDIIAYTQISVPNNNYIGMNHYSMVALFTLNIPTAGRYTISISNDDGMLFGINGATYVSGPNQTYQSVTAMNSYPIIGGIDINGNHGSNSYVVTFPNAGAYNVEVDYYQWETEQNLAFQIGPTGSTQLFAPIPIANFTYPQSLPMPPTWPSWTTSQAPAYPSVTEQGTYLSPVGGTYSPTGGGLTWANHGPASDFTWQANKSFTLPNTTIVDPTGSKEAPYRSGYSGPTIPGFALKTNGLSTDGSTLTWINQGGAAGLITQYGYNASGVLDQVTDPAGNITSYSTFGCGGLLPQTTALPPNAAGNQLSSNATWNCNTAITTAFTDANGNTQTWTYGDPLIRPTLYVDQADTQTTTVYTPNTVESTTDFSGGGTTIASAGPNVPQTGACTGPFQGFTCVTTAPLGVWKNPGNVGSTTNYATATTDQYDISQSIVSSSVTAIDPTHPILTVTMTNAFPTNNTFVPGSWVQIQGTQETPVNSSQYRYQVLTVNGATFTAAVCSTGESNCPSIPAYNNPSDTGYVRFNNYFSWSLNATNFNFGIGASSLVSGIVVTANVVTSCSSGTCNSGNANGYAAPYVSIALLNNSTIVGSPKIVQVPINGTTPIALGNQNDLWGASAITGSTVDGTNFGVAITAVQPDLNLGPEGQITWSVNSVTVALTYQAGSATYSTNDVIKYLDGFGRTYLTQTSEGIGSPNWDTVENDYNVLGQVVRTTLPFVSIKGAKSSTAPGTTYQYDAMGRETLSTDSETPPGQLSYAYNGQDVLVSLLPVTQSDNGNPNGKQKQFEYDGLDRLKSVCEITLTGYGIWPDFPCDQAYSTSSTSGYLTAYSYDSSNRLINVIGNSTATPDSPQITTTEITSGNNTNVLTVGTTTNNFFIGAPITLSGTNETYLNGLTVVVTTVSSTQFTANVSFSPYGCSGGPCADQGNATFPVQQSRSVIYDELGRISTQNDAESGVSTFVYDIATSPCPAYSSFGDLVQKMDAVGNVTCLTYDSLHRIITSNVVSGPYAAATPGKLFVYDSASVPDPGGTLVTATTNDGAGQIAAAYTCNGPCPASPIITTEVYSYDAIERPVTFWESAGTGDNFMITSESYFPNGAINSLGLTTQPQKDSLPGTSTFFYSLDGMGRVSSFASYINNVSSSLGSVQAYYPATSIPTSISYIDGDSDTYSFDPATLRMAGYAFTIPGANGGTWSGTLRWNANSSLAQLALSNTVPNTGLTLPTCNYQYDDLLRMSSEQCSPNNYSQSTLTYDPFGNPTNTTPGGQRTWYDSMTFNPKNNQIASFVGCFNQPNCTGPYHDANGNQVETPGSNLSFDAYGNLLSGEGRSMVYDAFDRFVAAPESFGSGYAFYRPDGTYLLNTGNSNFGYFGVNSLVIPAPGGSNVELAQHCSGCQHQDSYSLVYTIQHVDFHGSHVFGSCADATGLLCTINTFYFAHVTDAFGNVEANANSNEPGTFDGALGDYITDWIFPTRIYRNNELRFFHPEGHASVNIADPQSWNSYGYTRNNPLTFRDPLGLYEEDCPPDYYGGDCSGGGDDGGGSGSGGGIIIGVSNPSSNPPNSPGGVPPWQEWGNNPPWLTNPPSLATLLGIPYGTCDFGVCNPIIYNFTSTGLGPNVWFERCPLCFVHPDLLWFRYDPGPPRLRRGMPSPTPTASISALGNTITLRQAQALCSLATQLRNNGSGPLTDVSGDPGYSVGQGTNLYGPGGALNPTGAGAGTGTQGTASGLSLITGRTADYQTCLEAY
jgi:RHS repeat-associated protein